MSDDTGLVKDQESRGLKEWGKRWVYRDASHWLLIPLKGRVTFWYFVCIKKITRPVPLTLPLSSTCWTASLLVPYMLPEKVAFSIKAPSFTSSSIFSLEQAWNESNYIPCFTLLYSNIFFCTSIDLELSFQIMIDLILHCDIVIVPAIPCNSVIDLDNLVSDSPWISLWHSYSPSITI